VLRKIFRPEREEDGSWRKLHNDEIHSLHSSHNIVRVIKSRRMSWVGHVARIGEGRDVYRVLVGRPEEKRPVWRLMRSWPDNIKMDLRKIGIDGANWFGWLRIGSNEGICEHSNEPSGSIRKRDIF
jgi:hypothetical protein